VWESKIAALAAPLCLCAERRGSRTAATLGSTSRAIPACARLSYRRCEECAPCVSCITRPAFRDLLACVFSRENEAASLGLSGRGSGPFSEARRARSSVYSRAEGGILTRIACQLYDHGRFTGRRHSFSVVRKSVRRCGPDGDAAMLRFGLIHSCRETRGFTSKFAQTTGDRSDADRSDQGPGLRRERP
jgi:hypothetical protein